MKNFKKQLLLMSFIGLTFVACGDSSSTNNELKDIITTNNLTGSPFRGIEMPKITDDKAQLGMHLFFSKSLGADRDSACVTCHHPMLGGGDNLSLPIGVGAEKPNLLGEGRLHSATATHYDAGPTVPRNAPTTFNLGAWKHSLFHDGRIERIPKAHGSISTPDSGFSVVDPLATDNLSSAQSRFPITAPEEMKGFNHNDKNNQQIREYVASRVGGYGEGKGELKDTNYWLTKFRKALDKPAGTADELITEQNIAMLLGEYENSQVFDNTPWKEYIEGTNGALSGDEKIGALLFFNSIEEGGANCASCHKGDFFSDEQFHNIAMLQMGRGKGDGLDKIEDFGRFRVTGNEQDKYLFRTPTLLNVEVTGPWGHDGGYTTLENMVKHHLNAKEAINSYDETQLSQEGIQNLNSMEENTLKALAKLEKDRESKDVVLRDVNLSDVEVKQLVSFLKTLTDPCVKDETCLQKWVPILNADPNGDQLDAVDLEGNILGLN